MANSKLLKDAIADAKAVRETAIANAKIALEEAFTPRLQSILSKKLTAEMEEEDETADVTEEYGADDTSDADSTKFSDVENKDPQGISTDAHTELGDTDKETAEPGKEDENNTIAESDEDENGDGVNDDPTGAISEEEKPEPMDDNLMKDLGPIADMLRPSKEHSTFTQDVRIKEDLDRINQIMKKII